MESRGKNMFRGFFAKPWRCLFLWAVLRQVCLPPVYGLPGETWEQDLTRLLEISARLSGLNERLRIELEDSRKNSTELLATLETSRNELEQLRQELAPLRRNSLELLSRAEKSEQELSGLKSALRKAESSLVSLDLSYGAYKTTAEARITRLERSGRWLKYAVIGALALAVGGWTAFAVH
jgi:chromosome segregation ATPase